MDTRLRYCPRSNCTVSVCALLQTLRRTAPRRQMLRLRSVSGAGRSVGALLIPIGTLAGCGNGNPVTGANDAWWAASLATVGTLWLSALIARPRKPRLGDEVQQLVYTRLLGRQGTLALVAFIATLVMSVALMIAVRPNEVNAELNSARPTCRPLPDGRSLCLLTRADGQPYTVVRPGGHT